MATMSARLYGMNSFRDTYIYPLTHKRPLTNNQVVQIIDKMRSKTIYEISQLYIDTFRPEKDEKTHALSLTREVKATIRFTFEPLMNPIIKSLLLQKDTPEWREEVLFRVERTFSGIFLAYENACSFKRPGREVDLVKEEAPVYLSELTAPLDETETLENSIFIRSDAFSSEPLDELSIERKTQTEDQILLNSQKISALEVQIKEVSEEKETLSLRLAAVETELSPLREKLRSKAKLSPPQKLKFEKLNKERALLISQSKDKEKKIADLEAQKQQLIISIALAKKYLEA